MMIIHTIYTGICGYAGISKLRFTSVLCCVRFCVPCFVTECSLLVISLFFSPLCLLKLFSKMCVCFTHTLILHVFKSIFCFLQDLYVNVKTSSVSEPVRQTCVCQVNKLFTRDKTSVSS